MALAKGLSPIRPEDVYPAGTFFESFGISYTRTRDAEKQHGIKLNKLRVGKRHFVRGSDAIAFIEQLAALEGKQDA